jgi:hypothetical protein
MYQGIWSVLKFLLSEKAKSFINFTSVKELAPIISQDRILKGKKKTMYLFFAYKSLVEMGGANNFEWSIENDKVLQKYGKAQVDAGQEPELSTPPLTRSRSSSVSDDGEYFDARETFQTTPKEPVVPSTFKVSTKSVVTVSSQTPGSMIRNHPTLTRMQAIFKKFLYNLFQLTFGPQKGLVYWVLLYVILRGPVEKFIKRALIRSALVKSKRLNSTTIGITAAVAAIVSTGITGTLEKYRK